MVKSEFTCLVILNVSFASFILDPFFAVFDYPFTLIMVEIVGLWEALCMISMGHWLKNALSKNDGKFVGSNHSQGYRL